MRIPGKRISRTHRYETSRLIVEVEIEQVIPDADPVEPCYESETLKFLRQVHEKAEVDDLIWLKANGCRIQNQPETVRLAIPRTLQQTTG